MAIVLAPRWLAWEEIERDVVHSGCYQIPEATVTCGRHGAEGGVTGQVLKGCKVWLEHGRECL